MYSYTVYKKDANSAVRHLEYNFETTDTVSLAEVKELSKKKSEYWVSPLDEASATILFQRAQRKTNWTHEMVTFAHECRLKGYSDVKTQMEVYTKFKTVVTLDSVRKTLRQETNTEFELADGLREKVAVTVPQKTKRGASGRMTPELEAEIHAAFDAGMTGKEVGEKFGFSDSYVNTIRRRKVGYRAGAKAGLPVEESNATPDAVPETA